MPKYHINSKGIPEICKAKIKCRLSSDLEHFDNSEEAQKYADLANELSVDYIAIANNEPIITTDLKDFIKDTGAYLEGLEYRMKSLSSTKEKVLIRKDVESIHDLYDVIRYTAVSKTKDYYKNRNIILEKLQNNGYKVVYEKNTWERNGYKGINIKMESPEGVKFELQLHTYESLDAKEEAHKLYEERRLPNTSEERKLELDIQMDKIFNSIPIPKKNQ